MSDIILVERTDNMSKYKKAYKHNKNIFVMSDIHGMYDEFLIKLDEINFSDDDYLFILGDVVDRGGKPIELLQYIMAQRNMILLIGNHEQMMMDAICLTEDNEIYYDENSAEFQRWMNNGGGVTFKQFKSLSFKEQFAILDYLNNLYYYQIVKMNGMSYFLSHAGVDPKKSLKAQTPHDFVWIREEFYNAKGLKGYFHIFGHTPTKYLNNDGESELWFDVAHKDKLCIDCGAYCGGKLNCIRLPYEIPELSIKAVKKKAGR